MNHEWRTSSYSPNGSNCVAARAVSRGAEMRDTKNPLYASITVPGTEWAALLSTITAVRRSDER